MLPRCTATAEFSPENQRRHRWIKMARLFCIESCIPRYGAGGFRGWECAEYLLVETGLEECS